MLLGTLGAYLQDRHSQPLFIMVDVVSIFFTWHIWHPYLHRPRVTTHGSAAWARRASVRGLLRLRFRKLPAGGLFVGFFSRWKAIVLPPDLAKLHVLIVGGSGTGKTRGFFMPNTAYARGSFVATDPKGELWEHTSGYHERAWRYAPREPFATRCFNWIPLCRDEHRAQLFAAAVLQLEEDTHAEQFWKLSELQLCAALFTHVANSPIPTPAAAHQLLQLGPSELLEPLKGSRSELARTCARLLGDLKSETRAGVVLGVANKLSFLQDPTLRRFTSADVHAPDFRVLTRDPVAVYWVVHEQDAAILKPLSSLFFTVLLDQLSRGKPGAVPVTIFLDEFANIGRIPHFATVISVARGRGLSLVLGVQALSQLEGLYGRADASTIRTNCATKIVLHGLEQESAEQISRMLGDRTLWHEVSSRRPSEIPFVPIVSYSEQHVQRRLLTADEVRRIGRDECLLIISNLRAIRARREFWDRLPNPAEASGLGKAQLARKVERTTRPPSNIRYLRDQLRRLED